MLQDILFHSNLQFDSPQRVKILRKNSQNNLPTEISLQLRGLTNQAKCIINIFCFNLRKLQPARAVQIKTKTLGIVEKLIAVIMKIVM